MIISAKAIMKPRGRQHHCQRCRDVVTGPHLRLYGAGESGQKPYVIRVHAHCLPRKRIAEPKITAALEQLRAKL